MEPFVRRHWPQAIVSWTRLLTGGWRDPLVGRDVLFGVAAGCFWTLVAIASTLVEKQSGVMPSMPCLFPLLSTKAALAAALASFSNTIIQLLVAFFVLFTARALLRREWLAAVAFTAFFTMIGSISSPVPLVDAAFSLVVGVSVYLLLTKAGFVACFAALYVQLYLISLPLTTDFSSWFAGCTVFAVLVVAAIAAVGTRAALAGRSRLRDFGA